MGNGRFPPGRSAWETQPASGAPRAAAPRGQSHPAHLHFSFSACFSNLSCSLRRHPRLLEGNNVGETPVEEEEEGAERLQPRAEGSVPRRRVRSKARRVPRPCGNRFLRIRRSVSLPSLSRRRFLPCGSSERSLCLPFAGTRRAPRASRGAAPEPPRFGNPNPARRGCRFPLQDSFILHWTTCTRIQKQF